MREIVEFFGRPIDPAKIPFNEFRPDVLLRQNAAQFRNFAARLPAEWRAGVNERFYELHPVAVHQ